MHFKLYVHLRTKSELKCVFMFKHVYIQIDRHFECIDVNMYVQLQNNVRTNERTNDRVTE